MKFPLLSLHKKIKKDKYHNGSDPKIFWLRVNRIYRTRSMGKVNLGEDVKGRVRDVLFLLEVANSIMGAKHLNLQLIILFS